MPITIILYENKMLLFSFISRFVRTVIYDHVYWYQFFCFINWYWFSWHALESVLTYLHFCIHLFWFKNTSFDDLWYSNVLVLCCTILLILPHLPMLCKILTLILCSLNKDLQFMFIFLFFLLRHMLSNHWHDRWE